jgi:hypothetical protein
VVVFSHFAFVETSTTTMSASSAIRKRENVAHVCARFVCF